MKYKKKISPKVKQPYTKPITTIPGVSPTPVGLQQYVNGGITSADSLALYNNTKDLLNYYSTKNKYKNLDTGSATDININKANLSAVKESAEFIMLPSGVKVSKDAYEKQYGTKVMERDMGKNKKANGGWMDEIQLGLDAAQFVPVLGEAAYLASLPFTTYDVAKNISKGDYKQAGMDALGYIPGLKAFKYGVKGKKILDTTSKIAKQYNKVNNVVNTTNLVNDAAKMKKADGGELLGLKDIEDKNLLLASKTGGFMLNDKPNVITKSNFINASKYNYGGVLNTLPKFEPGGKMITDSAVKDNTTVSNKYSNPNMKPVVVGPLSKEKLMEEKTKQMFGTNVNNTSEIYQYGDKKGKPTGKGGLEESISPIDFIFPAADVAGVTAEGLVKLASPLVKAGLKLGAKTAKPIIEKAKPYVKNLVNSGLDELYNFKYKKEIANLPKVKQELLQEINTPEGYKRLKNQGIDTKSFLNQLNKTDITSKRNIGSFDDSNVINIDFDQLKKLKKEGYNLDLKSVIDHEIGHRMQRGFNSKSVKEYNKIMEALPRTKKNKVFEIFTYSTPLDKKSAELLAPLTKNMNQNEANYFFQGSAHHERLPFLRETKREMKTKGYINNIYDNITPSTIKKFLQENPGNRFSKFLETNQPLTHRRLSSLLNETPIITGALIGGNALQQENKKQHGGYMSTPKNSIKITPDQRDYNINVTKLPKLNKGGWLDNL